MTRLLVTGGGKGVGAAIVRALAAAGHDVDFTYRSSAEAATALADELMAAHPGRRSSSMPVDLADREAVDAFCETIEAESFFGLVHNAGQPYDALAADDGAGQGRGRHAGEFLVPDPHRQGRSCAA